MSTTHFNFFSQFSKVISNMSRSRLPAWLIIASRSGLNHRGIFDLQGVWARQWRHLSSLERHHWWRFHSLGPHQNHRCRHHCHRCLLFPGLWPRDRGDLWKIPTSTRCCEFKLIYMYIDYNKKKLLTLYMIYI